jgi:hypothetical protein
MMLWMLLVACYPGEAFLAANCARVDGVLHDGECYAHTALPQSLNGQPDKAFAFVTTRTVTGNLVDLGSAGASAHEVADEICNDAATAGGLAGTYRAWLSTGDTDAIDHVVGDGPWFSTYSRSLELFPNAAALKGTPRSDSWGDEYGDYVSYTQAAWTGTALGGRRSNNCANWTNGTNDGEAVVGYPADEAERWTDGSSRACSSSAALICLSASGAR